MKKFKMSDMGLAKQALAQDDHTYAIAKNGVVFCGCERGIRPLLDFAKSGRDYSGFCAADKIVGKAAALLYAFMGFKEVYGEVMSQAALKVFCDNGINASYGVLVNNIINRKGSGICPMECAAADISDPKQLVAVLAAALEKLKEKPL